MRMKILINSFNKVVFKLWSKRKNVKGDEYYAAGNERMGAACRKAALNAANRAVEADKHDRDEIDFRGYPTVK